MSSGVSSGVSSGISSATYGRGDLQAAFNWLVNQPEHIRKQASDPDRLMTLYYRSSGRPEMARPEPSVPESPRMETEAPVSSQNFLSDLRQINEAMRQFDRPVGHGSAISSGSGSGHTMSASMASALSQSAAHGEVKTQSKVSTMGLNTGASANAWTNPSANPQASLQVNPQANLPTTAAIISEVREKLNLSSDAEAINALVAIGYKSLKPLLT